MYTWTSRTGVEIVSCVPRETSAMDHAVPHLFISYWMWGSKIVSAFRGR